MVGAAVLAAGAVIAGGWLIVRNGRDKYGLDWDEGGFIMKVLSDMRDWLGYWAIPAYVALHTLTLAMCLPYAVFFEAGASLLFGFFPALLCVFSAKILGASLSFLIGRYSLPPPSLVITTLCYLLRLALFATSVKPHSTNFIFYICSSDAQFLGEI